MPTAACSVCSGTLFRSRNSPSTAYDFPRVSSTRCGHIHHFTCIKYAFRTMRIRKQRIHCPLCYRPVDQRLQDVQLTLEFPESEQLYRENLDLKRQLENADNIIQDQHNEIAIMRHRQELEAGEGAQILQPKRIFFNSSSCYNCESQAHSARDCKRFPVMRMDEYSPGTPFRNPGSAFFVTFAYNKSAAVVVRQMEKILGWDIIHRELTRNEVLVAFAVTFFHKVCWRCYAYTHKERQCPETPVLGPCNSDLDDCEEMRRILVEQYPDLR